MLVYGDHEEQVSPAARLTEVQQQLSAISRMEAGLARHTALAGAFIALAGIVQGVADVRFAAEHQDASWPDVDKLMAQLLVVASALAMSWDSDFQALAPLPAGLDCGSLPEQVTIRLPEGYAFYALYPEAYTVAARSLRLHGAPCVIGLRSIGTGLAAIVAAVLGAPTPITLRPGGDPFARRVEIGDGLASELLADSDAHYLIVDEGPGLSGSSFGAVADWLEGQGVERSRIAFLPGHDGPLGAQASDRHRERWNGAQRPAVSSNALLLPDRLRCWVETLTGPLDEPLEEIGGGAWRKLRFADEADWPPVQPAWERRKYLARRGERRWLVKFAGLGSIGEAKLRLSAKLAPFVVPPLGVVHGWVVEPWLGEARAARPTIEELGAYLAARAALPGRTGASLETLRTMIARNLPAALPAGVPDQHAVIAAQIDGRMAAYEWLRLPSGALVKCDALDHHASHDLIGCQDIAWDIAGASVELGLTEAEVAALCVAVEPARGAAVPADLLDFYERAYAGFRFGVHMLTAETLGSWPAEAERNRAAAAAIAGRYARP